MGNSSSSPSLRPTKNVFRDELSELRNIVQSMIVSDESGIEFRQRRHAFLSKDVCDHHAVMFADRLNTYRKVDLQSVGTALYLVPHADKALKKTDLCNRIADHYIRILYLLSLVFYIYDLENDGDLSIAGIVLRNIREMDGDLLEINYCEAEQRTQQFSGAKKDTVDFSRLKGLEFFVNHMLTSQEARQFMGVFRDVLARKPVAKYARDMDAMVRGGGSSSGKLDVYVAKDGPLFAEGLCYAPRRLLIRTNTKQGKAAKDEYSRFVKNYKKNVQAVVGCIQRLIKDDDIVSVTGSQLETIKADVCRSIKAFFVQSILDYQRILDVAKKVPSVYDSYVDRKK